MGQGGTPAPDAYAVAIGVPGGNIGGQNDAGWVGVLHAYDGENVETAISQNSTGVPGSAEAGDRFGAAVSINEFLTEDPASDDFVIDVVVGAPNEDVGSAADAGTVTVVKDVYFDEFPGSVSFSQDSAGVPGVVEAGDRFGRTVDTVRVGGTRRLAVGIPGEDVGAASNAGSVSSSPSAASVSTPAWVSPRTPRVSVAPLRPATCSATGWPSPHPAWVIRRPAWWSAFPARTARPSTRA